MKKSKVTESRRKLIVPVLYDTRRSYLSAWLFGRPEGEMA